MPLPETVRVKLNSEEAGTISITPVLTQEMSIDELFERIVSVTGKDVKRIGRILRAGILLDSATRFRWQRVDATAGEIDGQLSLYPDPDPSLPFTPSECVEALFQDSTGRSLRLPKEDAARRRFFRRRSFWDGLVDLAAEQMPSYVTYSYQDGADRYRLDVPTSVGARVRRMAILLKNRAQASQLRGANLVAMEFLVRRRRQARGPRGGS